MRVSVLCAFLSISALAYSQVPKPCIVPSTFSAGFIQRDQRRSFFDQGEMFYDANEQRIAYLVEVDTSRGKDEIYDLFLYKEGVRYTASRDSGECRKEDLRESFTPIGIPSNATFLTEFYLGSSGDESEGVLVELWVGNTTNPMGTYEILVTVDGCDPINDVFYDEENDNVFETFFQNIVRGIIDPNIFVPPKECL